MNFLAECDAASAEGVAASIQEWRRPEDIVVVSIHWGGNWGYLIPAEHRRFARRLIETARVDIIHGHSSHHPLGIEIFEGKPILYGCGDFINDYEGIRGHEIFRPDLTLAYFVDIDEDSLCLTALNMVPFRIEKFRLSPPTTDHPAWL